VHTAQPWPGRARHARTQHLPHRATHAHTGTCEGGECILTKANKRACKKAGGYGHEEEEEEAA
jgi:hypothetical protein